MQLFPYVFVNYGKSSTLGNHQVKVGVNNGSQAEGP